MMRSLIRLVEFLCARGIFQRRVRRCLYILLFVVALCIQVSLITKLLRTPPRVVRDFASSSNWRAVRDVVEIARLVRLPLFTLDKEAIRLHGTSFQECVHFCGGEHFQFGTVATYSNRREPQFCERLAAWGFEVEIVRIPNPRMVELIVELTAHYLIRRSLENSKDKQLKRPQALIHIVVFHERPDNFWWHAGLPENHRLLHSNSKPLPFMTTAGAYSKVEIQEDHLDHIRMLIPKTSYEPSPEFRDCNRTFAEEFYAKNGGRDSSPVTELFRIRVRKLIFKVKNLLAKHRIPFWLSSGTCLGWYRQCDIIPYTTDIDIGIYIEDYKPVLIDEFSTHDIALTHVFGHLEDSFELSFLDVLEQLKLDVFFFYREPNQTWNGGTQARTGHKYKYIFPPFKMCLTEFLDILVQVPCQTLQYIEANYGSDWQRPITDWDWKKSPPNVIENGVWPMEKWNQLIQLYPLPPY